MIEKKGDSLSIILKKEKRRTTMADRSRLFYVVTVLTFNNVFLEFILYC